MARRRAAEARSYPVRKSPLRPPHRSGHRRQARHRQPSRSETRSQSSRLFREAEALIPADAKPDPAFLSESAEALIDEKRIPAAEERLRKAIKAFPPDAIKDTALTLRRLAGLWESQGKNADAAHALRQRADAMDPK